MSVVIVHTIPIEKRCKRCDGWGFIGDYEQFGETTNYYTKKCPDCFGTGLRKPEIIPYIEKEDK